MSLQPDPDDAFHQRADELDAYLRDLDKINSLDLCNDVGQYAEYKLAKVSARIEVAQIKAKGERMTEDDADWLYRATVVRNMTDRAIRRLDGIRRQFQREAADQDKAQRALDRAFVQEAISSLPSALSKTLLDNAVKRLSESAAA
jgi:hypothetical protein